MKMKLCVLSVAGAMAFTGFSAFGTEKVSVAPGGGDDWQAITDAIANAEEQAVVELGAGEFVLTNELVVNRAVTLRGAGSGVTTLRHDTAAPASRVLSVSNGATVERLTVTGGLSWGSVPGSGVSVGMQSVLQDCEITGNRPSGWDWRNKGGGVYVNGGKVLRCVFHGNGVVDNNAVVSASSLYIDGGGIADSCLFYGDYASFQPSDNNTAYGVVCVNSGVLRASTVVGNFSAGYPAVYLTGSSSVCKVLDCIVVANTYSAAWTQGGDSAIGWPSDKAQSVASNLTGEDAGLVDAFGGDYRLTCASKAIDAAEYGDDSQAMTAFDVTGTAARKIGVAQDVGAYEFDPGTDPDVDFYAPGVRQVLVGKPVAFVGGAVNAGESPEYVWNFGDGSELTTVERDVTHVYSAPGTYTVTIRVSGMTLSKTRADYVTIMPKDIYVDPSCATPALPYGAWGTAANYIEDALAVAPEGATVWLRAGVRHNAKSKARMALDRAIVVRGETGNPADVEVANDSASASVFWINHADALLADMTVLGGKLKGTGSNGRSVHVGTSGGTVSNCVMRGTVHNGCWQGSGAVRIENGLVTHCVISNNSGCVAGKGSGVTMSGGKLVNCLVAHNDNTCDHAGGTYVGGAVHMSGGVALNCTVTHNKSPRYAGFALDSATPRVINCIVCDNTSAGISEAAAGVYNANPSCFSSCLASFKINDKCSAGDAKFAAPGEDDFRLLYGSDAMGIGEENGHFDETSTDLDGALRIQDGRLDAGCYAYVSKGLTATLSSTGTAGLKPYSVRLSASVDGVPAGATLKYLWKKSADAEVVETSESYLDVTYDENGTHLATLEVLVNETPVTAVNSVSVTVRPKTVYVDASNESPSAPYDTEDTAARTVEDALSDAFDGQRIVIATGTYVPTSTLVLDCDVSLCGKTGRPEDVILDGDDKRRVVMLNSAAASVCGVTLSNGMDKHGGGVLIDAKGGTVSNCVIRNANATLTDFDWNGLGGGVKMMSDAALLTHTIVTNCAQLARDHASHGGSALYLGKGQVRNCLFAYNHKCKNYGTEAAGYGVHGTFGTVKMTGGRLENCTICSNSAVCCAGVWATGGTIVNCVIADNTSAEIAANPTYGVYAGTASLFSRCLAPLTINDDCLATDGPILRNVERGDFRLAKASVGKNAGTTLDWMTPLATDLAGKPRIYGGKPDCGCYESQSAGLLILVK